MDTVALIVLCTLVAMAGVVIGSSVQKQARFILPVDFITIAILLFAAADALIQFMPYDMFWYVPFLIGYCVGYLVVGLTTYTMVFRFDIARGKKHFSMMPVVFYEHDGRVFIQEQRNIPLLRRFLTGIEHEVESNVPIVDDWTSECKYPMFPLLRADVLFVESMRETTKVSEVRGRQKRHPVTEITVAYGSSATTAQLILDVGYLNDMQRQNVRLLDRIHQLEAEQGSKLLEMALQTAQDMECQSPENRMLALARGRYDDLDRRDRVDPRPISKMERKRMIEKEVKDDADGVAEADQASA